MTDAATALTDISDEISSGESPKPLQRELPDPQPYPFGALGSIIGSAASALHQFTQAPDAICAQSALATANLAVQAHFDVLLHSGLQRPVSCYFLTIAESGERKTSADEVVLKSIREHEALLRTASEESLAKYELESALYEKELQLALGRENKDRAAKRLALESLGDKPRRPLEPIILLTEPTYEGLVTNLQRGQPSQGIFSSEAGRFISGHAMNEEHRLKTAAALSELWDGQPINRCRKGDGSFSLIGRRLAIHLMVQPLASSRLLADPVLGDQGLLSRLLTAYPKPTSGTRFYREHSQATLEALDSFANQTKQVMAHIFPTAPGQANELEPRILQPSRAAKRLQIQFADHIEAQLTPDGPLADVRGFANKLPEQAARLAATIKGFEDMEASELAVEDMERGIALSEYYLEEARRLFLSNLFDPKLHLAEQLLSWIRRRGMKTISLVEVYQLGPNAIRDAKKAREMMMILQEHNYLRPVRARCASGGKRREVWEFMEH